jgi:hypothetical protein
MEEKPGFDWKSFVENDSESVCMYHNIGELADKVAEAVVNIAMVN